MFTVSSLLIAASSASALLVPAAAPTRTSVSALGRREAIASFAAAAALLPVTAALADGANSAQTVFRARAIYGSRIYRLLKASSAADILEEKNAFKLFVSGAYRTPLSGAAEEQTTLEALRKEILVLAGKGDDKAAKDKIKDFVTLAKITELDSVAGGNFDPKQRRNLGAPDTVSIENQMGPEAFALYTPLDPKKKS